VNFTQTLPPCFEEGLSNLPPFSILILFVWMSSQKRGVFLQTLGRGLLLHGHSLNGKGAGSLVTEWTVWNLFTWFLSPCLLQDCLAEVALALSKCCYQGLCLGWRKINIFYMYTHVYVLCYFIYVFGLKVCLACF
jgi:hypothetical protein